MCGILGYLGKNNGADYLLKGLSLLEYRGYDSVGIGYLANDEYKIYKIQGSVSKFKHNFGSQLNKINITSGIGHTRWATHGLPTAINAHPHVSFSKRFLLIHNGIVENYRNLKETLQKEQITQLSQTDTEILANYLDLKLKNDTLEKVDTLIEALQYVKGSFAIVMMDNKNPNKLFLFRKKSPLVIAKDITNSYFVSSDINVFTNFADQVAFIPDNSVCVLDINQDITVFDITTKQKTALGFNPFSNTLASIELNEYDHFLIKEIEEQPYILKALLNEYYDIKTNKIFDNLFKSPTIEKLKSIDSVCLIGCGTSYHAAKFGEYIFEKICQLKVFSESGGEVKYRNLVLDKKTLYIFLSQSGETADLIAPIEWIKEKGCYTLAICNVINSTLSHIADDILYMKAGPEISVASTKAFTAQLLLLIITAQKIVELQQLSPQIDFKNFATDLDDIENILSNAVFNKKDLYKEIVKKYIVKKSTIIFVGRYLNYPIALEGALKMKEITYKNCDGMQMGELKHGALALIDANAVTIACESNADIYDKYISNIREVLSRNGQVISIKPSTLESIQEPNVIELSYPNKHFLINLMVNVVTLQVLSYFTALELDVDIDKPRNLAKSVTVE